MASVGSAYRNGSFTVCVDGWGLSYRGTTTSTIVAHQCSLVRPVSWRPHREVVGSGNKNIREGWSPRILGIDGTLARWLSDGWPILAIFFARPSAIDFAWRLAHQTIAGTNNFIEAVDTIDSKQREHAMITHLGLESLPSTMRALTANSLQE